LKAADSRTELLAVNFQIGWCTKDPSIGHLEVIVRFSRFSGFFLFSAVITITASLL
jgi:hypothetical protein